MLVKAAAQEVIDSLPSAPADRPSIWPTEAEFTALQGLFGEFFEHLYQGIELPETVTSEEVMTIMRRVLANLGYTHDVIPQEEGATNLGVNNRKNYVKVPLNQIYERPRIKGLIGHEIGIHVVAGKNGEQQPLRLLGRGLRGSIFAGEGKGVLVEQLAYDTWDEFMKTKRFFNIALRYFSLALARGMDGSGGRDFKQVFKIIHALDKLWLLAEDPNQPERANNLAIDRTWELLTRRTLKGIVGRGAAYYQTKVYSEGNISQQRLLAAHPEAYPYLNLGLYDLSNKDHISVAKRVGVIPVSLELAA